MCKIPSPLLCCLLCVTVTPVAVSQTGNAGTHDLPSLQKILNLHGKPTSHPDFVEVQRICGLELYLRNEEVTIDKSKSRTPRLSRMKTLEVYGGSGLVVEVTRWVHITGNLSSRGVISRNTSGRPATEPIEPEVSCTKLIVGDCAEKSMFGLWQGELPKIDIPRTPDALLEKYSLVYTDLVEAKYIHGGATLRERKRVMNYYAPAFGSQMPFAFEFAAWAAEEYKLAMIWIWPENVSYKVIAPEPPSVRPNLKK